MNYINGICANPCTQKICHTYKSPLGRGFEVLFMCITKVEVLLCAQWDGRWCG